MVRFVKKYLVLMVVAVLFVGAFLLNLKTNAAKTGSGEGVSAPGGSTGGGVRARRLFCHIPGRSGAGA